MFLFPLLTHPLSIGFRLLLTTILIAIILIYSFSYSWISYILILILLGGLLVIFIYVTLAATNERFRSFTQSNLVNIILLSLRLFLFTTKSYFSITERQQISSIFYKQGLEWITKFYSLELCTSTLLLLFYLLLTLIIVVFNTKHTSITLRRQC